jgi:hypothetical protein
MILFEHSFRAGLTSQSNRVIHIVARVERLGKKNFPQLLCHMHAFTAPR